MPNSPGEPVPPRIPPLTAEQLNAEQRELVSRAIVNDNGVVRVRKHDDKLLPIGGVMLHHPRLHAQFNAMGNLLMKDGELPARDRELIALRVGWLCQTAFQWAHHVLIAHKLGMSPEDVERIAKGASEPGWAERDRALLSAVDQLHSSNTLSDTAWDELQPHFSPQQLIELIFMVGWYHSISFFLNGLRILPDPSLRGLQAR